jgi:hypothetical protein
MVTQREYRFPIALRRTQQWPIRLQSIAVSLQRPQAESTSPFALAAQKAHITDDSQEHHCQTGDNSSDKE